MLKKNEHHTFTGMQTDPAVSKQPSNFLIDAKNIRLTQRNGDTLLAITNEKGTRDTEVVLSGSYLGHCLLNQYLVVFSKRGSNDFIDMFNLSSSPNPAKRVLFTGNLGFEMDNKIEAIGSYETESVQKVYWTDGYKQPRMINIMDAPVVYTGSSVYTKYDFVRTLQLLEEVKIKKDVGATGMFPAGVIQYAFTYYDKFGQETAIFYTSPLLYTSYKDRGGSPEDKVSNAFKITVSGLDNFEYLRIYSIMRTSINGTPICKRVQDICIAGLAQVEFIDTGTEGNIVDPTELLYKGGENIAAGTIEQKDGTLFLGDIKITRKDAQSLVSILDSNVTITCSNRSIDVPQNSTGSYVYGNQLTSTDHNDSAMSVPCGGFKYGNYYRLGVQFQHETGVWSDPVFIGDYPETNKPSISSSVVTLPTFKGVISSSLYSTFIDEGYKRARAVVVFPEAQDKVVMCQGVANPTMKTDINSYYQSSWFYRPSYSTQILNSVLVSPTSSGSLPFTYANYNPSTIRRVEIQGNFWGSEYSVVQTLNTLNSPDLEFDSDMMNIDFSGTEYVRSGYVSFTNTMSDIEIQTETPTASSNGSGFIHKNFNTASSHGIVSGLFYDDYVVDDLDDGVTIYAYDKEKSPVKWMVYPWQKSGALNNDFKRPADKGTTTALLKKKIISNLRYADTSWFSLNLLSNSFANAPQLFSSDQVSILKCGSDIYMGNVDTLLNPVYGDGDYFAFNGDAVNGESATTNFDASVLWRTYANDSLENYKGLYKYVVGTGWHSIPTDSNIGNQYKDLVLKKESVRMKYKSSPHLFMQTSDNIYTFDVDIYGLPVLEIRKPGDTSSSYYRSTMFGSQSNDALKANNWLPCGEPVMIGYSAETGASTGDNTTVFFYSYGDTYFQRYDCLKTYAFTKEDVNQVIEIGSFMLETYTNIDGRYDRNRGQMNNLNMSPENFNLLNPVYSQRDNFFTYKIMDSSFYENNSFPNQITWTKEKQAGADVDLWTNITLASTYDMDGSKGRVQSLNSWKDQLFCFQNKGISNILFNSRVQIPTSDGVPIEISNSYKVDGYRYISDGIGCVNKWTIKETPSGIYFIDSVSNDLYIVNDKLENLPLSHNMKSWFRDNSLDRTLYDDVNHDVYVVNDTTALCYSEILGQFTSFMDYGGMLLVESYGSNIFSVKGSKIYQMFDGEYNHLFNEYKSWYITFVSNGIDEKLMDFDKVFSNIDYRLDFFNSSSEYQAGITFDYMRAWNEYQDTQDVSFTSTNSNGLNYYPQGNPQKKFRIWRIQIPRAKKLVDGTYKITNDRIRNPWCRIKLGRNSASDNFKAILQDLNVQYYL